MKTTLKSILSLALISLLAACGGAPSYESCEKYHWKIVYDCKDIAGVRDDPRGFLYGPRLNDNFYRCLALNTMDDKKYNQCRKAGHIIQGYSGLVPSRSR
jgi:hypothetical protein